LRATLDELGMKAIHCHFWQDALEPVVTSNCSTLIVDFDVPGAFELVRMATLLPPPQRPNVLAIADGAYPGNGRAFLSGASRVLYKPLEADVLREALQADKKNRKKNRRKTPRCEARTLVFLELEKGPLAALSLDIGEYGFALHATEPVPMASSVAFRFVLPGTETSLRGHADVMWSTDSGRAGLCFSKLSPVAREHLRRWLRSNHKRDKNSAHELLPPMDAQISFAGD